MKRLWMFLILVLPLGCAAPGPMMREFDTDPDVRVTYVFGDSAKNSSTPTQTTSPVTPGQAK